MKITIIRIFFFTLLLGCQSEKKIVEKKEYSRWVGDIEKNDKLDDPDFKTCNGEDEILQYFNLGKGPVYFGEKSTILNIFKSKFKPLTGKNQNGLVRIRFVVNCEGKAGRFRILQSDYNYEAISFHKKIITQIVDITKAIDTWKILNRNEVPVDYYFYLIFKISDGKIIEILP
jgi:hypothetical protein